MDLLLVFIGQCLITSCIFVSKIVGIPASTKMTNITNNFNRRLAWNAFLKRPGHNMVISPLLLKIPLCKIASHSRGKGKEELMSVLGFQNNIMLANCYTDVKESMKLLTEADLVMKTKIYYQADYQLNVNYLKNTTENYGLLIDKVGFNFPNTAMRFINSWVETETFKRITQLMVPGDINKNTSIVIINAVNFRPSWELPFDVEQTKVTVFKKMDGSTAMVHMMVKKAEFQYYEDLKNDFKLVTLYLQSWGVSITYVVPGSAIGLAKLLVKLKEDPDLISRARKAVKYFDVTVEVPRVNMKTNIDWGGTLKQIGLKHIFDMNTTDLDGVLQDKESKNLHLSKAKQKTFVIIDEFGAFRSEKKFMDVELTPRPMPGRKKKEVIADRPFLFTVNMQGGEMGGPGPGAEGQVGSINELFVGVYFGPEHFL